MKILQVITSMHIGGAEKVVMELILGLRALGHDVDVALFSGEDTDFKRQLDRSGCRVFSFSIGGKTYNPIYILKLWRIMHRYDIVHTHNTAPQLFAAIAGLGSKAKLITTEHSSSNRRREKGHLKWFDNWLYGRYDTIVCIADQAKQAMETYLGRRMDDVAVINNGVNVEDFHSAEPASELYPHCGKFVIAMVAGFRYEKDQDTVIKAMTNLTDGYELWLVGDGVRRKELEALIETEGVKDRVKLLGIRKDVSNILHAADVVIMSSHREGLSLSNVEGMSVGKPFIASDVDGLREVTQNYGILFPHKDAIALAKIIDRLHTDKDYYHTVADRCYKRALEFDVNKMVEGYIDIYRSLI